jgi:manganese/zinc/iron transport system permease protein
LVAAAFFLFSLLFAPNRGAVAFLLRRAALRRRIALQNLLRSVYEELERAEGGVSGTNQRWRPERLCRFRDHPRPEYHRAIRSAMQSGLVTRLGEDYLLTPEGVSAARRIVRAHRLWEIYLIERAEIAPDHVDRDADEIEHILEAPLIEALEAKLRSMGRLPAELSPSPHTLSEKGEAP